MKVVIVGGVAGGATAAARIRRLDENAQIVVFERSGFVSYANCGLPYYIGGVITDPEELLTLFNDLRVFIAIFPNKLYFHFQGFKIILQLLHLILECGIIQTDQV